MLTQDELFQYLKKNNFEILNTRILMQQASMFTINVAVISRWYIIQATMANVSTAAEKNFHALVFQHLSLSLSRPIDFQLHKRKDQLYVIMSI